MSTTHSTAAVSRKSWKNRLAGFLGLSTPSRSRSSPSRNRAKPGVEALEDRQLLAASLATATFSANTGLLHITGTEANDTIVVNQVNSQIDVGFVPVNGKLAPIPASSVKYIWVESLGGDDKIWIGSGYGQPIEAIVLLDAGAGNDYVSGSGSGLNAIKGGAGNDEIWGGSGNDILYGGGDNDRLSGLGGHDQLFGGDGIDYLYGGSGVDILHGGANVDYLYGEADADYLMYDIYDYYFGKVDGGFGNIQYAYVNASSDVPPSLLDAARLYQATMAGKTSIIDTQLQEALQGLG